MSYPKALKNLGVACNVSIYIDCKDWGEWRDSCWGSCCVLEEFDATKLDGYRAARKEGWTYDSEGNWSCPDCSGATPSGRLESPRAADL